MDGTRGSPIVFMGFLLTNVHITGGHHPVRSHKMFPKILLIELDDGKFLTGKPYIKFDGKNPWVSG